MNKAFQDVSSSTSNQLSSRVPDPVLERIYNPSKFKSHVFDCMGINRQFYDIVLLKGTFNLSSGGLKLADIQENVVNGDEYWDEDSPETSSLKFADDADLYKPSSDVFITGTVKSFEGKPQKEWRGMLRVVRGKKNVLIQKTLLFTGPRWWKHGVLSGWTLSDPTQTTEVPLRYELAYGGHWINPKQSDPHLAREIYSQNPSGSGHFGASHNTWKDYPGPQIELHPTRIHSSNRKYVPGGFGPIAKFWYPRAQHAGTYDEAWLQQFHKSIEQHEVPDYPTDFDYRYFQAAPSDQITPEYLVGDEWIEMVGLFQDQRAISFQLPRIKIENDLLKTNGRELHAPMRLDTVHIDIDNRKVYLTWRLTLPQKAEIGYCCLRLAEIPGEKK